jgi:peptidyl-prolyl cis-trans isomerase C
VVALIVGALTDYVIRPRQVLASVNGTNITRQDYWRTRGVDLVNQIDQYSLYASMLGGDQAEQYRQAAAAAQAELDDLWGSTDVNEDFLQRMVEDQIYVQYADDLGIEITDDDLDLYVLQQFQPQDAPLVPPTATPTLIPTRAAWATETAMAMPTLPATSTPAAATPNSGTPAMGTPVTSPAGAVGTPIPVGGSAAATPLSGTPAQAATPSVGTPAAISGTPAPVESPTPDPAQARQTAEAGYRQYRDRVFDDAQINEGQYKQWVAKPQLARQRVEDLLVGQLGQSAPQIHAAHILVATQDLATQLTTQLDQGADFQALAAAQSIDTATAPNGGDLGWFTQWDVDEGLWNAAQALEPGQYSAPFQSQYGWHIVLVFEKSPDRPMTNQQLDIARTAVVDDWLAEKMAEADIESDELEPTPTPSAMTFTPPVEAPPTPTLAPATPIVASPAAATPGAATPAVATPIAVATPPGDGVLTVPEPPAASPPASGA